MDEPNIFLTHENVFLPLRSPKTHKGDYGRIMIIGGSVGYSGAPKLSAKAALRVGAGLVYMAVPDSIYSAVAASMDEAMVIPFPSDDAGRFSFNAVDGIAKKAESSDALVIGPGLGRSEACNELVRLLLSTYSGKIALDADGLYALSQFDKDILTHNSENIVLTPHYGEFFRLTGKKPDNDPLSYAKDFAKSYKTNIVLKGSNTVICFFDGTSYISKFGNPGMATGGSGDVLSGMIGGFMGQMDVVPSTLNSVYIHGRAGDLAADDLSEYGMLPSDIITRIPVIFKQLTLKREGIINE